MTTELASGTVIDNRYVVEDRLGSGGMAVVYRVRHRTLGTPMALKLLTVNRGSVKDRLLQEGRVQAALRHPNVVAALDTVELGEKIGLVMEYVRGPTLHALITELQLDWHQIDDIARGMFDGIEAAHAAGLVHRDLKPDNVLIEIAPGRLIPKIADFGLVKLLDLEEGQSVGRTRTGTTFGTPEYMAPEQISDVKGVDARADVFSVGVMLFELVTGRKPFADEDLLELFNRISKGQRATVQTLRPDAPERMVRAIDAALVPDRNQRAPNIATVRSLWTEGAVFPTTVPWSAGAIEQVRRLGRGEDGVETLRRLRTEGSDAPPSVAVQAPRTAPNDLGVTPSVLAVEQAPARRRMAMGLGVIGLSGLSLGAGVLAVVGILGWVAWSTWSAREAPISTPISPGPTPVAVIAPVPAPEVVPASPPPTQVEAPVPAAPAGRPTPPPPPVPEAPDNDAPVVALVTPPAPEPAAPPPPQQPPPTARVRVEGAQGITIELQAADGEPVDPGQVAAGDYRLFAFFTPGVPKDLGPLKLAPGARFVVRCNPTAQRCAASPE